MSNTSDAETSSASDAELSDEDLDKLEKGILRKNVANGTLCENVAKDVKKDLIMADIPIGFGFAFWRIMNLSGIAVKGSTGQIVRASSITIAPTIFGTVMLYSIFMQARIRKKSKAANNDRKYSYFDALKDTLKEDYLIIFLSSAMNYASVIGFESIGRLMGSIPVESELVQKVLTTIGSGLGSMLPSTIFGIGHGLLNHCKSNPNAKAIDCDWASYNFSVFFKSIMFELFTQLGISDRIISSLDPATLNQSIEAAVKVLDSVATGAACASTGTLTTFFASTIKHSAGCALVDDPDQQSQREVSRLLEEEVELSNSEDPDIIVDDGSQNRY